MPTKILVADDSATMRRVLEMTFAGEDASVVAVENGESAVAKAAELSPDVVFADISMNGVDGYEVARRIKSNPALGKVAVIVMASQHHPYDDGKGRAAGVDDHISKPFDTQSVIDRVGQVLGRPRQSAAGAEPRAAAVTAPPVQRPAPAAAVPAAPPPARGPATATRMGIGAVPLQASPPAKPAPQPVAAPAARPQATSPMVPVAAPRPTAAPAAPAPAARPAAAAVASAAASADFAGKLSGLGLTKEQVEGVLAISRDVIEQVVWEVVPDLAEQIIREEIKRLTAD